MGFYTSQIHPALFTSPENSFPGGSGAELMLSGKFIAAKTRNSFRKVSNFEFLEDLPLGCT
jgi:hypothetical protein